MTDPSSRLASVAGYPCPTMTCRIPPVTLALFLRQSSGPEVCRAAWTSRGTGRFAIFGDISAPAVVVEVSSLRTGQVGSNHPLQRGQRSGCGIDPAQPRREPAVHRQQRRRNGDGGVFRHEDREGHARLPVGGAQRIQCSAMVWVGGAPEILREPEVSCTSRNSDGLVTNMAQRRRSGVLRVASNGTSCTLTESVNSPQSLAFPGTLSLFAYPPRPY